MGLHLFFFLNGNGTFQQVMVSFYFCKIYFSLSDLIY